MKRINLVWVPAGLAVVLALAGCPGDEPEQLCDPNQVGSICTIAGSGMNGYDLKGDDQAIAALEAKMSLPQDTLTASDRSIYILDWNNHRIRRLDGEGMLHWVAGRGELGGDLDDPANDDFNHPTNLIFERGGEDNIVIAAWHNSKIRHLNLATGVVTDTCGDGKRAYFGDQGPAMNASLDLPASIAWDPDGNLVILDQANQVLRLVDGNDNITLLAGRCIIDAAVQCEDGVEPVQCPDGPNGPSGKFTCGDPATECSKPCTPGYSGDDIPASEMRMAQPFGQSAWPAGRIVFDPAGNLYFADTGNAMIRMIDTDGIVRRIAGLPPVDGQPRAGYSGDGGPALAAQLNFPVDLALAEDGTLYFSDVQNHCIRAIDPQGIIRTVAGRCGEKPGFAGDGGPAEDALLNLPFGIELVGNKLIISDTGNSRIRTVLLE